MTIRIAPIVGIFSIAGACVVLTGCDDIDDAMRVLEGKPTKAQVAHEKSQASVSYYVSPTPSVERVEVAFERVAAAEPCVVPAHLFRSMQCDEATGQIIPIR